MKIILVTLITIMSSLSIRAEVMEQKVLFFDIQTEKLYQDDIHYFFELLKPREVLEKYPELFELDSLSLHAKKDVMIAVSKAAYVVDKAVGVFDHEHMKNEKFISHLLPNYRIRKTDKGLHISVPGELGYHVRSYFDSDDITTLPNSRVTRAVATSKKLDVISQSASSIVFKEFTKFSDFAKGSLSVTSYIALKENKTLVISYQMTAVISKEAKAQQLQKAFVDEITAVRKLTEEYEF